MLLSVSGMWLCLCIHAVPGSPLISDLCYSFTHQSDDWPEVFPHQCVRCNLKAACSCVHLNFLMGHFVPHLFLGNLRILQHQRVLPAYRSRCPGGSIHRPVRRHCWSAGSCDPASWPPRPWPPHHSFEPAVAPWQCSTSPGPLGPAGGCTKRAAPHLETKRSHWFKSGRVVTIQM